MHRRKVIVVNNNNNNSHDNVYGAVIMTKVRKEGHPACKKTEWWGAGVVICLDRGADLYTAQPMPLPLTVFCLLLQ